MQTFIKQLLNKQDLSLEESYEASTMILTQATNAQVGAFLSLLSPRVKR